MTIEDEADMEACERSVLLHRLLDSEDLPMIHLLRANGDLLPEVEGDTIAFELEYTGALESGPEDWQRAHDSVVEVCAADRHYGGTGCAGAG